MTEVIKIPESSQSGSVDLDLLRRLLEPAADALKRGALVAFPTETVYGLGANALDPVAVARIFEVKGRPFSDPLIVHVLEMEDAVPLVTRIPDTARKLAASLWPGPLTLILSRAPSIPSVVTAGLDSVALRAPSHVVARRLISMAGVPVAAPSANPFGRTSPTTAAHVLADLEGNVDFVVDGGPASLGVESTVVDCRRGRPRVLRPGGVSIEELRAVVGEVEMPEGVVDLGRKEPSPPKPSRPYVSATSDDFESQVSTDSPGATGSIGAADSMGAADPIDVSDPQRSPGMLLRHYAPEARAVLIYGEDDEAIAAVMALVERRLCHAGRRVALLLAAEDLDALAENLDASGSTRLVLGARGDARRAASVLFSSLRKADEAGAELIIARDFGTPGLGLAVRDRLWRAAEGRALRVDPAEIDGAVERTLDALIGG